MKALFIDVETTGLEPETCVMTEIAWAIFDTEDYTKPYAARSYLIETDVEISDEIIALTGITNAHTYHGNELSQVLQILTDDIAIHKVQHMVAHNGAFDMGFLQAGYLASKLGMPILTLIDSAKDVPYPKEISTRTLRFLATEHGFMNPFPHSAIFDVFCMAKVVSHYAWNDILEYKNEPEVIVKAHCDFHTKELAKKARFSWEKAGDKVYSKTWVKALKQRELAEQSKTWEFTYEVIS